jgi:hypothetical protein
MLEGTTLLRGRVPLDQQKHHAMLDGENAGVTRDGDAEKSILRDDCKLVRTGTSTVVWLADTVELLQ